MFINTRPNLHDKSCMINIGWIACKYVEACPSKVDLHFVGKRRVEEETDKLAVVALTISNCCNLL